MRFNTMKKVPGMNRRTLLIDTNSVLFLEEHELEGNLVTNIHFNNGKWVSATLSLDEATGALFAEPEDPEVEKREESEQLKRFRRIAKLRAESQREIDQAMKHADMLGKVKGYSKETLPDGSGRLVIEIEPKE